MKEHKPSNEPMLNVYPDSLGGDLSTLVAVMKKPELQGAFSSMYILPSLFNTDLDRGFSVISYDLNERLASERDLEELRKLGIDLKLDFILNHSSVLSKEFQDILKNGHNSRYKDFFINWNSFWEGHGEMNAAGYVEPRKEMIQDMFFRKPGLPILMVRFPNGEQVPYWNTFYQSVTYPKLDPQDIMQLTDLQYQWAKEVARDVNDALGKGVKPQQIDLGDFQAHLDVIVEYLESQRKYLGQMDLNIHSPLVWSFYEDVLETLAGYGAKIVRLDAFAYAPKEPGARNFLNAPGTWTLLEKVQGLADKHGLQLLPEIHASYAEKTYETIAEKGYRTYDFFLPGLLIDALESGDGKRLKDWADEILEKKMQVINMLGCHDGIPLLDLKGLLPEERIEGLIDTIVARGGMVKNLHGQKNVYYQVNATYYSALNEEDDKMLMARAIQLFMPGKPQVWYLDLFAGVNDEEAVKKAGPDGHKEINRTNLSLEDIEVALAKPVVQNQLELLKFRNTFQGFSDDAKISIYNHEKELTFLWNHEGYVAILQADLKKMSFEITAMNPEGQVVYKR